MKRFEGLEALDDGALQAEVPIVVTLGNFDGVHRGHRLIIEETIGRAHRLKGTSLIYTFFPHPVQLLAPDSCPPLIQTIDQRLEAFEDLGIDACVVEHFTFNYAHMTPHSFFDQVLISKLHAAHIVIGYDFTFGLHRRGTAEVMQHLGNERGIGVSVVDAQFSGDLLISSTEIRRDIQRGDVERARELMGRPFALRGTVVKGHGIGKTLGVHTANLTAANEIMPEHGVYITHTRALTSEATFPSITSIGHNPTFDDRSLSVETHLLDYDGDLLGQQLDVLFMKRLRGQIAFDSPQTLKGQIERDITSARSWHEQDRL